MSAATPDRIRPEAKCPLRPDEICNLCQLYVTGPQDCGLVYLVMNDDELRADWAARRRAAKSGPSAPASDSLVPPTVG